MSADPILASARVVRVRDALAYERIWAAAGHPSTVFAMTPAELVHLAGGETADLARADAP